MLRIIGLVAMLGLAGAGGCGWIGGTGDEDVVRYEVVRGDTLFLIAKAHGVTVDDLRAWNGLEGDLIEVGQVLEIRGGEAPAPRPAAKRRPRPKKTAEPSGPLASLRMPPAQPCLVGPSGEGLGDEGMAASAGLSYAQVKSSMDAFVPNTLRCLPDGGASGRIDLQITVACSGRVQQVVVQRTTMGPEVTGCVVDVLKFAPFPAHDLPDGESFGYPLTFGG